MSSETRETRPPSADAPGRGPANADGNSDSERPDGGGGGLSSGITSSLKWTSLSQAVRLGTQFVSQIVLARLLTPADFGIAAMAFVISGFAAVLAESGIQAAIIQRPTLSERTLSSAFVVNLLTGATVSIAIVVIAPIASSFYGEHQVQTVLVLTAPAILISASTAVHRGLLERKMQFRRLMLIEILAGVVGTGVAIAAAGHGAGVYALPINMLVGTAVGTMGILVIKPWFPRARPTVSAMKDLAGFSGNLLGFNIVNYWARNLDNLLVARYLGAVEAGYYTRAYAFLMLPLTQMSAVLGRVMFPSFSSIQNDHEVIRSLYLSAIRSISTIMWLPLILLAVTADRVVPFILGPQWYGAAPITAIFALLGTAQVVLTTVGWLFLSQGATRLMLRWGMINSVVYALAFLVGVWLGSAMWVAVTYSIAVLATGLPTLRSAGALVSLPLRVSLTSLAGPALCAAAALLVALPGYLIDQAWLSFSYQITAGSACFLLFAHLFRLEPLAMVIRRLRPAT